MAMNTQIALADTFWTSFAKLPKSQTKKVVEFVTKFRQGADSSGIKYEKIRGACQSNYRSVRIDQAYRGIVLKPDTGKVYILLWVDHHDNAYAWAERTKCEIHPETGALQLYEAMMVDAPVDAVESTKPQYGEPQAEPVTGPEEQTEPEPTGPLFSLERDQLLGVGVPESMLTPIGELRKVSELEALQAKLPVEAFEALYLFADGLPWGEIWGEYYIAPKEPVDTSDVEAALARDTSKRRFRVIEGELELQEMLAAPLEKWRVFLHPSQRKLVDRHWNGPVRVLGGAGTGKTVVAIHRAAWLAKEVATNPTDRILFLTYITNLAQDIKNNLAKVVSADEMKKIEVVNIDAWVSRFLKARDYPNKIVGEQQIERLWKEVLGSLKPSDPELPDSFYKEEWDRIILPNRVLAQAEYLRVPRKGRGVALNRKQRAALWPVFDEMRSQMQHQGLRTYQDASLDASDLLDASNKLPYVSVVVDETQDMGAEALTLIRKIVPEGKNDLFLVGDGHQRIYRKRAVMGQCGIKIVGRSHKLKINYRTTEQIRRYASALLEGQEIDDMDDGVDAPGAYTSLTQGLTPEITGFDNIEQEAEYIAETLQAIAADGTALASCCVVLRTQRLRDNVKAELEHKGISTVVLEGKSDNQEVVGVRLATMHRVKGLEFRQVFLAGVSKGVIPNQWTMDSTSDPVERRALELSERALLHVASSRAIERLYVTYHGKPSEYL